MSFPKTHANFPSKGYARRSKAVSRIIKEPIASAEVSWLGRGRDGEDLLSKATLENDSALQI